jgi:hypothetical protein
MPFVCEEFQVFHFGVIVKLFSFLSWSSKRGPNRRKRKTRFVSMKVFFFNFHWFFFFSSSKTNTWAMRAKL